MTSLEQRLISKDNNWSGYVCYCQENGLCPKILSNINIYLKAVGGEK